MKRMTRENRIPVSRLKASDFSTRSYEGKYVLVADDGSPVIMLRSKTVSPVMWSLKKGRFQLFFRTYGEVLNYCENHHYSFIPKGQGEA